MKRFVGKPIRRNEDARLLTGQALFVDDVDLPAMLHAAFLRSNFAHARIRSIDASAARARPGVHAVFEASDLGELCRPGPLLVPPPPIDGCVFHERTQVPLASEKVRTLGEPLAVVIAESRYIAEDALADILVDLEPLEPVAGLSSALDDGAPLIHEDLDSNLAAHVIQTKGDYETARREAALVLNRRFDYDRGSSAPMENRGIVASWDRKERLLTVWDTTQAPIPIRNGLASMLGLSEFEVRVIAPFIGGGFGPKMMMFYPEEIVIPWAAMKLGVPIKWIEDREESFFATTNERGQIHDAEMAVDAEGRILGVKDVFLHDTGAYDPYGLTVPLNSQCTLLGPYDVPSYSSEFRVAFTNKTIVTPYRGAGRPHGVFVMERLLDFAARKLGIDRVEIRRRNLLQPDAFPHDHGLIYQDFKPLVYDSGEYEKSLDSAVRAIDWSGFPELQTSGAAQGRALGIGLVCYVEGTGIGPYEGARVTVESSGQVNVAMGVGTQGQGHATAFAQVVAEQVGVEVADVRVVTGDTAEFHWGTGTFASRGAVVAANACHAAGLLVRRKILDHGAEALEAPIEDLEIESGRVFVRGVPDRAISLGELALRANPLRGGVEAGTEPGLEATAYFGPESVSTANGVHAMVVEVDRETLNTKILRYVVVHDCGTVINPLILEGQIQGGVAQGIGNSFYEQLVYDDNAQLLNASFMDYLIPTATDVPEIEISHEVTPSPLNPLGTKGAGEAGTIPVAALFAQAVEDALSIPRFEILEMPLSPNRLFELVAKCRAQGDFG